MNTGSRQKGSQMDENELRSRALYLLSKNQDTIVTHLRLNWYNHKYNDYIKKIVEKMHNIMLARQCKNELETQTAEEAFDQLEDNSPYEQVCRQELEDKIDELKAQHSIILRRLKFISGLKDKVMSDIFV